MKKILPILLFVICLGFPALAQAPGSSVSWTVEARQLEADMYELVFTGKAAEGWHTYGTGSEYSAPYGELTRPLGLRGADVARLREPCGNLADVGGAAAFEPRRKA